MYDCELETTAPKASRKHPLPSTRLYALLARKAPVGVVFRRGPSKQVLLLRWDLKKDLFHPGQWLKGRIYERRADLSPNGERLIYLAGNQKPPHYAWTAISRPPYLTAGVLWWANSGTCGGGGLFDDEENLRLNEHPGLMGSSETRFNVSINRGKRSPAPRLNVTPLGPSSGSGEDHPILSYRLKRDGWKVFLTETSARYNEGISLAYAYDPPFAWRRSQPIRDSPWELRMLELGKGERQGPWSVDVYELANVKTRTAIGLGQLDWADWCPSGDFLFSKDGMMWRLAITNATEVEVSSACLIADLRPLRFRELAPPPEALTWDEQVPLPPPLELPYSSLPRLTSLLNRSDER